MAVGTKYLYVKATDAGTGIRQISVSPDGTVFRAVGDNTIAHYPGRTRYSGEIVLEDWASVTTLLAAAAATKYFDVATDDADARLTVTGFQVHKFNGTIGDGTKDGDVVGFSCTWVGTGLSVGAAA